MTPLQHLLSRFLPERMVLPAMAILYALLMIGAVIAAGNVRPNIYLDIG